MSCQHGEETFPCNQSSEYCLGCSIKKKIRKKKFPLIEEEEITTKDGAQIKKTKRTKTTITKDGVVAQTTITTKKDGVVAQTTITTTKKDGVLTRTKTTTKDGVPEKTTTTRRKYGVPAKTTTNDEAPITTTNDEAPEDEVQA